MFVAFSAGLLLAGSAAPQLLSQAEDALREGQFSAALANTESALDQGGMSAPQRLQAYRIATFACVALGNTAAARTRIRLWLTEDPSAELPPGTAPKIRRLFEDVRASMALSLAASQAETPAASQPASLVATTAAVAESVAPALPQVSVAPTATPKWVWYLSGFGGVGIGVAAVALAYVYTRPTELDVRVLP